MSVKKALVVAGGECLEQALLVKAIKESELVVAADSGAQYLLKAGKIPDAVIGDLDSCDKSVLMRLEEIETEFIILPTEKNVTDTEAAIDYCVNKGFKYIELACAIKGKRIDHLLGSIFLLPKYLKQGIRVRLLGEANRFIELISDEISFSGPVGTFVSLFALSGKVYGLTTKGLKYPLEDAVLSQGKTLAVSNEIAASKVSISLSEGLLLVVREKD